MRIDSAAPPTGFAQNDSIVVGVEISNGNERRVKTCTCGGDSTYLALPVFVLQEESSDEARFSSRFHHIERP